MFEGHRSIFLGPLSPLFWTSGDICPGFQRQDKHTEPFYMKSTCTHGSAGKRDRVCRTVHKLNLIWFSWWPPFSPHSRPFRTTFCTIRVDRLLVLFTNIKIWPYGYKGCQCGKRNHIGVPDMKTSRKKLYLQFPSSDSKFTVRSMTLEHSPGVFDEIWQRIFVTLNIVRK